MLHVLVSLLFTVLFMFLILRAGRRYKYECAFFDPGRRRLAICQLSTVESYRDDEGVNEVVKTNRRWRLVDTETGRLMATRLRSMHEAPVWQQGRLVFCLRHHGPEIVVVGLDSLDEVESFGPGELAEDPRLSVDSADGGLAFQDNTGAMRKVDESTCQTVPADPASLTRLPASLPGFESWSLTMLPGSPYETVSGELFLDGSSGPSLGRYICGGLIATRPLIPGNMRPRHAVVDDCVFVVHRKSPDDNAPYLITKVRTTDGQKLWTLAIPGVLKASFLDADTLILVHDPGKRRIRITGHRVADGVKRWSTIA